MHSNAIFCRAVNARPHVRRHVSAHIKSSMDSTAQVCEQAHGPRKRPSQKVKVLMVWRAAQRPRQNVEVAVIDPARKVERALISHVATRCPSKCKHRWTVACARCKTGAGAVEHVCCTRRLLAHTIHSCHAQAPVTCAIAHQRHAQSVSILPNPQWRPIMHPM